MFNVPACQEPEPGADGPLMPNPNRVARKPEAQANGPGPRSLALVRGVPARGSESVRKGLQ